MPDEFSLQEELLALASDPEAYSIDHEVEVPSLSAGEIDAHLSSAIDSVVEDPDSITHSSPTTFDVFRSILKYADSPQISGTILTKTLDTITSSLGTHATTVMALPLDDMDAPMVHKTPLEMWAFLLQWFVVVAEKGAGKGDEGRGAAAATTGRGKTSKSKKGASGSAGSTTTFVWAAHIPAVLQSMHRTLKIPTQRIWRTSSEREAFVSCFTKPAYQLAETEAYLKDQEIKIGIYKVICFAVKFHSHAFGAQTSIIQNLTYFEHLAEYMAELLTILYKEFDYGQLGEEILRDIAGKSFAHNDQKGPKVFARFLVKFAEECPKVVQKQMALLLAHLDSEAYPMRMAIIEIIGLLIQDISMSDEGDAEQKEMQIKRFFGLLMDRFLDLNAFVRGKVMVTLARLCDLPTKFPKQRAKITVLAIRTLEDKTATCRKNAIQLLHKLIQTHPFGAADGGSLYLPAWQDRYDQLSAQLEKADAHELEKAKRDVGVVDSDEEGAEGEDAEPQVKAEPKDVDEENQDVEMADGEAEGADGVAQTQKKKKQPRESQLDMAAIQAEQTALDPNLVMALRMNKKYHTDALRFINAIEDAVPVLAQLLVSTNKSEALEAIRFFRIAYEYRFVGAEVGIKTMIHLIWTKDNTSTAGTDETEGKGIRGSLIETYKSLYFDVVPDLAPKQQVNRIARNMIERTYNATLAELTSLEELMRTMMLESGPDGGVHEDVINKLWQVYSTDSAVPKQQRQGAIIILGMLAVARREVVTEQVESLLRIGLGQHGMNDLVLARYTCIALQRLGGSAKKVKGSLADKTMRLPMDNPIFQKLQDIIERAPRSPQWFGMAEQAINTIYLLGEQPDQLCSDIIRNLTERVFNADAASVARDRASTPPPGGASRDEEDIDMDSDVPPTPATLAVPETPQIAIPATPMWNIPATPLAMERTSSQGSIKEDRTASFPLAQLVFTVGHVAIKHIVYLELVEREFKRRKDEAAKLKAAEKDKEANAASNDLDAVAGNAEDDIGDTIANIRESELLYGEKSLLRKYGRMIAAICANPRRYRAPSLRLAATLALTKLMCVSGRFCEGHLLLLFNILEKSKDPSIRSNIVIALGDIAVSFGSLIDENSDRLYQGLSDTSGPVKKNTLMVLTHLILNGMIKVKGQLGEMAKCLEDDDPRISDLAKLFFKELSTKDNALYNNLQDVISHLSVGKFKVDEESFEKTMRFIFTFIEKDKQAEAIVEKLCQRFRLATDERQWRDIAFCLSLLPFKSERSMKKLIEGLPFYQDKLHEEKVYQRFNEILTKARSNRNPGKPETELKEFENILAEHQAKGLEERALEADVARKTKAAKRRAAKRTAATTTSSSRNDTPTPVKADRPKRGRRRAAVAESDDEEDE